MTVSKTEKPLKDEISSWFQSLQDQICKSLEEIEGAARFKEDIWERPAGGGGRTRVIQGNLIEKGGVNFSAVYGPMPQKIAGALQLDESHFYATGVSIVLHPLSPMVPIIHMNVRYFETDSGHWWFGGGIDLTPHYVVEEDARYFHQQLKNVCDQFDLNYYPAFRDWADKYFYNQHREETRGIGGIFFDRLSNQNGVSKKYRFEFVKAVGDIFTPLYIYMLSNNKNLPYGEREKKWQYLRRGRYVEYNLVYDKGTKFGLDTQGRIESILMSLPPVVHWDYDPQVIPGSKEEQTLHYLKSKMDWSI